MRWQQLERDFRAWEEWVAELMETHLSYPILGYYRSQHVNQNWLAALTAMVDVAAFVTAVEADGESEQAELTYAIGRHALSDLAVQYRVADRESERFSGDDFDRLYAAIEDAPTRPVGREEARGRLSELRAAYEPQAEGLSALLALELPPWRARRTRSCSRAGPAWRRASAATSSAEADQLGAPPIHSIRVAWISPASMAACSSSAVTPRRSAKT
jgi:hypothetical protein